MSKRIVICQNLKDLADYLDENGNHDQADLITENLFKFSSNDPTIRKAINFRKMFRGIGKFLKPLAPMLGTLLFQTLTQKNAFKNVLNSIKSGKFNASDILGQIMNDPNLTPQQKQKLATMVNKPQVANKVLEQVASTEAQQNIQQSMNQQIQQSGQQAFQNLNARRPVQPQAQLVSYNPPIYDFYANKAQNPATNIPYLIRQIQNDNSLDNYQKQELISMATNTMFESKPPKQPVTPQPQQNTNPTTSSPALNSRGPVNIA